MAEDEPVRSNNCCGLKCQPLVKNTNIFSFFPGMMILFDDDGEEEWRTNEAVYDDIKDVDYDNRKQLL